MNELLALPIEAQIVLLAGYLSYQVSTMGRAVMHRTEDVILQVVTFGSLGRLATALALTLLSYGAPEALHSETARLIIVGICTVAVSLGFSMWWRRSLSSWVTDKMSHYGIYRDDHQSSAWRSLLEADAKWSYVQLHCTDGVVYEADFKRLPDDLPGKKIILHDDGIALYVTRLLPPEGEPIRVDVTSSEFGNSIDYFPRTVINHVEIGWKKNQ